MSQIQIAVIDSGWVMVGRLKLNASVATLENASVIRVWGTSKGLGQIALDGPTAETKLDKIGTVQVERSQLKFLIECDDKKWEKKL
jgi:hypothetical protein